MLLALTSKVAGFVELEMELLKPVLEVLEPFIPEPVLEPVLEVPEPPKLVVAVVSAEGVKPVLKLLEPVLEVPEPVVAVAATEGVKLAMELVEPEPAVCGDELLQNSC